MGKLNGMESKQNRAFSNSIECKQRAVQFGCEFCRTEIEECALRWLNFLEKEIRPDQMFSGDYGHS